MLKLNKTTAAGSPFIRKLNRHPERCKANQRDAKTALEITDGDFILHDFFFFKQMQKQKGEELSGEHCES